MYFHNNLHIVHTHSGGLGLLNTNYARVTEAFSDASIAVTLMAHQSIGLKVTTNYLMYFALIILRWLPIVL